MFRSVASALCLMALALSIAACGANGDDSTNGSAGNGERESVAVDGSSTVFPITQAVAEEFQAEGNENVRVSVGVSGTGGGFEKFCAGETDISNASRPIKDEEKAACQEAGIEFVELAVAQDGLSVVVNPENDFVDCLTVAELNKIWRPGSEVDNWSEVRDGFPDQPIKLYGPGTDSGTFDYFTEVVNGEEGASRSDYTASEDDNVLVQGVAGDPNALGYFGYGYYQENRNKLKVVSVDGGEGCVEPTPETINSGEYAPLSRPIFIYVSNKAAERDVVRRFVDFYLDNTSELSQEVGFVPVADDKLEENREEWEQFTG